MNNPKETFAAIRRSRKSKSYQINKLYVGNHTYIGSQVQDGFYESVRSLKTCDSERLRKSEHFQESLDDYRHIIDLSKEGCRLDPITEVEAFNLLQRMKPDVPDYYSVTPNHYIYAGPSGWRFFCLLLNTLISDISNTSISEVNLAYACILFKGHGKSQYSARSYRTISTCPVAAKALDLHVRDKKREQWSLHQAPTQFQGIGSSHEFAAILLTECIQYSIHALKQPLFALYLDAKSAFDVVQ